MCSHINAPAATKLTGATNLSAEEKSAINCSTDNTLLPSYPDVLDTKDVAEILGIKVATVRQMCRLGQIPSFSVGSHYRTTKKWLTDWMNGGGSHE